MLPFARLLFCSSPHVVPGMVHVEGEQGTAGEVNRVLLGNGRRRSLGAVVDHG